MSSPLSPENTKSWLRLALDITDKATSVTLLLILIIGTLFAYYMLKELGRTRQINADLWKQLVATQQDQVALAWRCSQGAGRPHQEEP